MSSGTPLRRLFDPARMRRYLADCPAVLLPHLWAAAHVRQAIEAGRQCNAAALLRDAAEEAFSIVLKCLFISAHPVGLPEKKLLIEEHFRACGLGKLELKGIGDGGGEAVVSASPFDECWVSTYGRPSAPVNLIAEGFLAAAFAAVAGSAVRSFAAEEIESIAMGAAASRFRIARRK